MNDNKRTSAFKEKRDYDILNMLNSISNFEIFTPFEITKSMIELLPEEVFKHPEYKFLDPCVKSGIFLREIIYKLDENLPRIKYKDKESNIEYDLSNKKERTTHILKNMIYGIAISELTSYVSRRTIYGVMEANKDKIEEYLQSKILANRDEELLEMNEYYNHNIFNDREEYIEEGNIFYPANETTIETEDTHYPFIVKTNHKIINRIKEGKMKFDVIIGNPPYQSSDGGHGASAKPLYHKFVLEAKKLDPKFISMIIPARWYSGGKGKELENFRIEMMNDSALKKIIDYSNSNECFSNVDIKGGICYFLWDKNNIEDCTFINKNKYEENIKSRKLNQFYPFIIRQNKAVSILEKVIDKKYDSLSKKISSRKPFGLPTNFKDYKNNKKGYCKVYGNKTTGFIEQQKIPKIHESFDYFKVITPKAADGSGEYPISVLGRPILAKKEEVCTETYLVANYFETEKEALNFEFYLKQKFTRFLISLIKNTQDFTKEKALFVPDLNMEETWDDNKLYKHFNLSKEEIDYIEQIIKKMD